ncbi:hypothetical protein BaRGS_00035745 [Batillaria attramentaria]|uniref:Uncharacterized protein n=1 Tax=Batillaria attramentaria TaxID=370345 RepID=A0ABD0JEH7_9CAEN
MVQYDSDDKISLSLLVSIFGTRQPPTLKRQQQVTKMIMVKRTEIRHALRVIWRASCPTKCFILTDVTSPKKLFFQALDIDPGLKTKAKWHTGLEYS